MFRALAEDWFFNYVIFTRRLQKFLIFESAAETFPNIKTKDSQSSFNILRNSYIYQLEIFFLPSGFFFLVSFVKLLETHNMGSHFGIEFIREIP